MNQFDKISCEKSILIMAFSGWSDAAEGATNAISNMIRQLKAEKFASIDDEEFFAFTRERPLVKNLKSKREIMWHKNDFYVVKNILNDNRDLILVKGTEPHLKWKTFSSEITELLMSLNVEGVVTLGALLDSIPHTRGVKISITGIDPYMPDGFIQKKIEPSQYEGPTGITSVILEKFKKLGVPSMSVWAHAPHYLQSSPNPLIAQALLSEISKWLSIDLDIETLSKRSKKYIAALDNAISQDSELRSYIEKLENKYDSAIVDIVPSEDKQLLKDLEKFLKTEKGKDSKGID